VYLAHAQAVRQFRPDVVLPVIRFIRAGGLLAEAPRRIEQLRAVVALQDQAGVTGAAEGVGQVAAQLRPQRIVERRVIQPGNQCLLPRCQ
jgi:hypothetical protein